jgi:eukaryotic-like serine/threonine-protein kinase
MAGKNLGRFEIKSLLGKGAMGAVYLALDPMLNREVAIKVVRFPKDLDAGQLAEMKDGLLKEARLAAGLSHPGIVRVFDAGEQDGQPFVVLELIRGKLLSEFLKEEGLLEFSQACHIFKELLSAMSYAHQQGVVHLDLKPANIMIGKESTPRIMDFGIARSIADLRVKEMDITGTPRFMAPEQIAGEKLDPRVDVFSLGVIFYLMLSGRLPFPSENFDELKKSIINDPHPPLQSYLSDLPRPFYEFVDHALNKSPNDRFESAVAMYDGFIRCLEDKKGSDQGPDQQATGENAHREILNFIMQRIKRKGDFPAVSQYVSEVVQAARSQSASAQSIAQSILKDISLTNRVLRIANSAYYSGLGSPITTISRAVVVLGMDAILNITSALGIFEHFLSKGNDVVELKKQVVATLFTALNARQLANQMGVENAEEPFICGMLHHLGRLIICFYFPEEQKVINKLVDEGGDDEEKASRKVMRLSYTELGQAIADSWKLPKLLQSGLRKMDPDRKGPLKGKEDILQGITSYAYELGKVAMIVDSHERGVALANLARKFDGKISIKPKMLQKIVDKSIADASGFSKPLRLSMKELGLVKEDEPPKEAKTVRPKATASSVVEGSNDATVMSSPEDRTIKMPPENSVEDSVGATVSRMVEEDSLEDEQDDKNELMERQGFLTKTIGDIAMTLVGQFSISDIIMMVLEGMYRGIGMRNVMLAMVTPKRDRIVFRFGLGPEMEKLRAEFDYPLQSINLAPALSILKRQEIVISDLEKDSRRQSFPESLVKLLEPKSIVLIPVMVKNTPIGLFLAMRSREQPIISELELQSVRMLVNQAVLALHQAAAKR